MQNLQLKRCAQKAAGFACDKFSWLVAQPDIFIEVQFFFYPFAFAEDKPFDVPDRHAGGDQHIDIVVWSDDDACRFTPWPDNNIVVNPGQRSFNL